MRIPSVAAVASLAAVAAGSLFAGAAIASEQTYVATGALEPFGVGFSTYAYMEVFGIGSNSRYANPATDAGDPYHALIAGAEAASVAALGGFTAGSARFSYDAAASPYSTSSSGNSARYAVGPIGISLTGSGSLSLSAADTALFVGRTTNGHTQSLSFTRTAGTVEGPVPGSTFSYGAAASAPTTVDLVSLLGPGAYYVSGFDLSGFATLPVRLTAPTQFRPVGFAVAFSRTDPAANFGITPPAALQQVDWNNYADFIVYFDGVYQVAVDPADYASNDAYQAASSWVGANIRQIDFEQSVSYTMSSLAAVPEPAAAWLLLAGLTLFPAARAGRSRSGA